jgi:hypothetical protein
MKTQTRETMMETWVPALGASTAAVDMDAVLGYSVVAWLLSRLLPERKAQDQAKREPTKPRLRRRTAHSLQSG